MLCSGQRKRQWVDRLLFSTEPSSFKTANEYILQVQAVWCDWLKTLSWNEWHLENFFFQLELFFHRFGAKWVFAVAFAVCTAATLLSPLAATLGYGYLIAVRVIAGVASVSAIFLNFRVVFLSKLEKIKQWAVCLLNIARVWIFSSFVLCFACRVLPIRPSMPCGVTGLHPSRDRN